MKTFLPLSSGVVTALLLSACGDSTSPLAPMPDMQARLSSHGAAIDVSGSWNWSRTEQLTVPAWVAQEIFGIQPEGPRTRARCTNAGTLELIQSGTSFTGTRQVTAAECVTAGGQSFVDPLIFVPAAVTDGQVRGRQISFVVDGVVVDCRFRAVISQLENGMAVSLSGGGHCVLPGHPQSEIPADPPPGGMSHTLSWTATRP